MGPVDAAGRAQPEMRGLREAGDEMMANRPNQKGFITFTGIIMILVIAAVIFVAFRALPPYISNYQLQDSINNITRSATYSTAKEDAIRNDVLNAAEDAGVVLDPSEVSVKRGKDGVEIAIDYTVTVDLMVKQLDVHFTPSAGNRLITAK